MSTRSWCFFFNDTATTEIYTLSLHDALPIYAARAQRNALSARHTVLRLRRQARRNRKERHFRSEEHTSELQSRSDLVCRLLLEKKNQNPTDIHLADQRAHTQALYA